MQSVWAETSALAKYFPAIPVKYVNCGDTSNIVEILSGSEIPLNDFNIRVKFPHHTVETVW